MIAHCTFCVFFSASFICNIKLDSWYGRVPGRLKQGGCEFQANCTPFPQTNNRQADKVGGGRQVREMTQQLRELAVFPEDTGSDPSTTW